MFNVNELHFNSSTRYSYGQYFYAQVKKIFCVLCEKYSTNPKFEDILLYITRSYIQVHAFSQINFGVK